MIRKAEGRDVPQVVNMLRHLAEETSLPLTFNTNKAMLTVAGLVKADIIFLVAESEPTQLAGVVFGWIEEDFCDETQAYISKFYIEKDYRGTGIARELLEAFDVEAMARGADLCFASSTAGMGELNEKLYVRLFEKRGYNVLGRVLVKEFKT